MKKIIVVMLFILLTPFKLMATGIPTFDAGTVAQLIQNALEAAKQAQEMLDYYKDLYEGNSGYGNGKGKIETDQGIPTEWKTVFDENKTDMEKLREEYDLKVSDSDRQKELDSYLYQMDFFEKTYQKNIARANRVRELSNQLNTVTTPQQREDLNNKLAYEQLELQADQTAISNMKNLMEQQKELIEKQREHKFNKMMLGNKYIGE